jgi:competence protein ComEC
MIPTEEPAPELPSAAPPPRRHRPLVPMVGGVAMAIVIAERSADRVIWGCVLSAALAGLGVALARRCSAARGLLLAAAGALMVGYVYTLASAVYLPVDHVSRHLGATPVTLEGQVLGAEKAGPGRTALELAARALIDPAGATPVSGRVRITAVDFEPAVHAGDDVRIHRIRLRRPGGFRNPGAFDYGRYLARRGIYATGTIGKAERLEVVQRAPGGFWAAISRLKADLAAHIGRTLAEPAAAITQEMVLGVRGGQAPEVREAFAASGTAHLLSVSGLHVGFVYATMFAALRFCLVQLRFRLLGPWSGGPRPSKLAAAGSLLAVVGYAALVGANFPTIRATLMIATYVLAYLLDRDGDPFQTAALAALLILALSPLALFDIGFQLSFAGVLAILYAHRLLHPPTAAAPRWDEGPPSLAARVKARLRDAVFIAAFASLGTAPLIVYYFQRLPLVAPLANIVVLPLASVAVPFALVAAFAAQIVPALGEILLSCAGMLMTWMYAVIRACAELPLAAPRLGAVSLPLVVLAYGVLLLAPYSRAHRWARWGVVGGAVLGGLWFSWPWLFPDGRGRLQVTFLDVGQGEASFVRFPHGATMLIDGGGSYRDDFDIGARVVAPFLWYQRVRGLDYAVATHPHPDHAKGLRYIVQSFRLRQFWDNGAPLQSAWYREIREAALQRGVYRDVVAEGFTSATIDGVRLELLHPTAAFRPQGERRPRSQEDRDENNRSLVLKLTYGAVSVLFPGDIEREAEDFLLHTGRDVQATILKAPHHGSHTSSSEAFLRAVGPSVVMFSVQRDNRFGHPNPAVLARYEALGARVFRTDEHGAITVRTDGRSVWIEPAIGEPAMLSAPLAYGVAETRPPSATAAPR